MLGDRSMNIHQVGCAYPLIQIVPLRCCQVPEEAWNWKKKQQEFLLTFLR